MIGKPRKGVFENTFKIIFLKNKNKILCHEFTYELL